MICGATATLNFDSINASLGPANAAYYLSSYGITLSGLTPGTEVVALNDNAYGGRGFIAPSQPNVLTQTGPVGEKLSYTLDFPCAVSHLQFTRPFLIASTSGQIFPEWTATAYNPSGGVVGSVGQALIRTFQNATAVSFNINGTDITSLRFDSNGQGIAGYSAVLIDNLFLSSTARTTGASGLQGGNLSLGGLLSKLLSPTVAVGGVSVPIPLSILVAAAVVYLIVAAAAGGRKGGRKWRR